MKSTKSVFVYDIEEALRQYMKSPSHYFSMTNISKQFTSCVNIELAYASRFYKAFNEYILMKTHRLQPPVIEYRNGIYLPLDIEVLDCCRPLLTILTKHPDAFTRHVRSLQHLATEYNCSLFDLRKAVFKVLHQTSP